jgi:hypothetical protein
MAQNNQQQASLAAFRTNTRQQLAELQTAQFTQFGQTQEIQIQSMGLLANLFVSLTGSITTGAGTPAGSFPSYPESPYNLIKNITVKTSQGVQILNLSGIGLARFLRMKSRANQLTINPSNDFSSSNNFSANYAAISAAAATASTVYPAKWFGKLPIETDDWLQWGMLLLQNDNVRLYVDVTLGSQADICGNVSGVSLTPNFTLSVASEFFSVPNSNGTMAPNLSFVHTLLEDVLPFSNVGDVIYSPVRGQIYTAILGQVENAGAPVSQANINNVRLIYAQNVNPYFESYPHHVIRNFYDKGIWLPDGMFFYDFANGYGVPEIYEPRDFMNTSQQTDFRVITNITGISPSSAQIRFVKEQLGVVG